MGFVHVDGDDESGRGGQRSDSPDGGGGTEHVRQSACQNGTHRVPGITPEPVDANS